VNWTREKVPPRTPAVVLIVSGHALDQEMAVGEQTDEDPLQHRILSGDDSLDLEEGLLETVLRIGRGDDGRGVELFGHVMLLLFRVGVVNETMPGWVPAEK
jgi:hypothetical protein